MAKPILETKDYMHLTHMLEDVIQLQVHEHKLNTEIWQAKHVTTQYYYSR